MRNMKLPLRRKPKNAAVPAKTDKTGKKGLLSRLKHRRAAALALACVLAAGFGIHALSGGSKAAAADLTYTTAQVERRDVTSTITGSGTLAAADSYSVTTLLEATILSADFQEGDTVQKGTVLYTLDDSDAASSLEQSELSLSQAQRSYANQLDDQSKLSVTAPAAGRVYTLDVEAGDEVNAGQTVATLRDSDTMELKVPFPADEAAKLSVGQSAAVTLDSTFETLNGTVTAVNGSTEVLTGNVQVRYVTIAVPNPGGLSTQQSATAAVGSATSTASGTFAYQEERTVTAKVSGTVARLNVAEGDKVSKGQTLVTLTSDDLSDQLQSASDNVRNAELSYEKQTERLEDYTITSPIDGTIIDKNYNAGETTEANQTLCTIYDLSYLTMTLSVDELDIANIAVGQTVSVTADAVEDRTYTGTVTKVSVAGTSTGSATTYPVTIRIDETDGLLPGMSVDATIELDSASDVLTIPAAALNRGNTVLVTADSPSAVNGTAVAGPEGEDSTSSDYVSVSVTTGVSDDNYVEITSGLQEGDTVAYIKTSSSGNQDAMMMGGPGGGMPGGGGGMPSGGGGGGAPGGGPGGF